MDVEFSISQIQQHMESKLRTDQSLTYESVIIPAAKKVLNMLKNIDIEKWPTHKNIANDIDIYIEALSIYVIYNYSKNIEVKYPPHIQMLVLLKHPYFINVFTIGKNREEWEECSAKILDDYLNTFGKNVTIDNKYKLKRLLSESSTFGESVKGKEISERSGLSRFNYMLGFHYLENEQGILKEEVVTHVSQIFESKNTSNFIYIVVNISFNVENTDSIIIYKELRKNADRILSNERVQQFDAFKSPDIVHKATEPVALFDHNFKRINHISDDIEYGIVLLSYNDSESEESSHFIIARYGENAYLNRNEINDFLKYRIMKFLDSKLLEIDLIESFYINYNKHSNDLMDLKRQYVQLATYTKNTFEQSTKESFVENFIKNVSSVDIFHQSEIPYLKLYLQGINILKSYEKDSIITFVTNYIYPDLMMKTQL